jgi:hypothetical protein
MTDKPQTIRPRRIRYQLDGRSGATNSREDMDNPLSANFVPPDERGSMGSARWFALHTKKFKDRGQAELDG